METPHRDDELLQHVQGLLDAMDQHYGDHEARLARLEAQYTALLQAHIALLRSSKATLQNLHQALDATPEGD
jgi:hypothetical protein